MPLTLDEHTITKYARLACGCGCICFFKISPMNVCHFTTSLPVALTYQTGKTENKTYMAVYGKVCF